MFEGKGFLCDKILPCFARILTACSHICRWVMIRGTLKSVICKFIREDTPDVVIATCHIRTTWFQSLKDVTIKLYEEVDPLLVQALLFGVGLRISGQYPWWYKYTEKYDPWFANYDCSTPPCWAHQTVH